MIAAETVSVNATMVGVVATLVAGLIIGGISALRSIKKDTISIEEAKNVVELAYDMSHVKEDIAELKIAMNNIQGMIENLLQSHVATQAQVRELLRVVPKRKGDSDE